MVKKHEVKLGRNQGYRDFEKRLRWMLDTYRRIFSDEFDTLERINARIKVRESATPKFRKACALRPKVDKKLDRLVEAGILSKVEQSEHTKEGWVS